MSTWQEYIVENRSRFIDELKAYLAFPSVSAIPEHAGDVRACGEWLAEYMRGIGIENVELMETGGHPVVYGDYLHAPGKRTVMIYGHWDVQPVDPLELWETPPYEGVVKGDKIYARGASDNKGNSLAPLQAVAALLATGGTLPVNVKFFFEGQEEIGSPTLPKFIAANREKFACDWVISSDGSQYGVDQPQLLLGLRGLCALQIDVKGPGHDVHSGVYGGAIANPITALTQIIDSLRTKDGKILVEGFLDDVAELSEEDRGFIDAVPFDESAFLGGAEVSAPYGEPGFSTLERLWARPTIELNGFWGGYMGAGSKTVIPSEAHAKITCRLVANQDPVACAEAIKAHVLKHTPAGIHTTVTIEPNQTRAYLMPSDHPGNQSARDVLYELYGKEPFFARMGASIPVCTLFKDTLDVYTVNFGFALDDDNVHSPNESWRLESFYTAHKGYAMLLERLAQE